MLHSLAVVVCVIVIVVFLLLYLQTFDCAHFILIVQAIRSTSIDRNNKYNNSNSTTTITTKTTAKTTKITITTKTITTPLSIIATMTTRKYENVAGDHFFLMLFFAVFLFLLLSVYCF